MPDPTIPPNLPPALSTAFEIAKWFRLQPWVFYVAATVMFVLIAYENILGFQWPFKFAIDPTKEMEFYGLILVVGGMGRGLELIKGEAVKTRISNEVVTIGAAAATSGASVQEVKDNISATAAQVVRDAVKL